MRRVGCRWPSGGSSGAVVSGCVVGCIVGLVGGWLVGESVVGGGVICGGLVSRSVSIGDSGGAIAVSAAWVELRVTRVWVAGRREAEVVV